MIKLYRTILFVIVLLMLSGCDNDNEVTKDTSIESSVCKDEKNITDTAKFNESFFDDRAYEDWILYDGEIYDPKHDCGTGLIGYDTRSHIKHLLIEDIHCTGIITLPNGIYFMTEKGIWEIQKDKIELIISHTTGGYSINNGYILNKDDGQTYYDLSSEEEFTINTKNTIISGYIDENHLYYTTEKELRVYNLKTGKDKLINTGIYTIIGMEKENIYLINNEKLTVVDVENGMNSTYEIEEGPYDDYHIREGKLYAMRFVDDTEENDNGKIIKYDIDEGKISYRTNIHRMTNGFYNYDNIYIMTPDIKTIEYDILNMIDVKKAKRPSKNDFFFIYNKFINDYTLQNYQIVHDGYTDKVGKSFLTMDMNSEMVDSEDIIYEDDNTIVFKMLISGIEYWNESIVVLYNKKKDDIEVVIRDIEPEVWQQDLFQFKLIDEWIYFYDQRYGGDEESRIIGISRINVDTYEIQKIAPVQGNRIDYIANDNYVVIHDRFDRNGDNNEYIKIYSMVNKKGIKIAELDDGIVNAYEGKKSLGCIRDKYLYYTNGDYNLVKVNLENIKERSTIVEDIDKILGDIYLGNNIFYIDADGYISMYYGSKSKKISKLKVRSGIFHWNDFQGTLDPGLPGYSYKKYNQWLYQDNFIYYVSENDHLMTINLEDLSNEKLANDCKYVLGDTGVKNNSLYYVGNNKKLYELDVISKERDSIEEIYKDEIYYYRNSLIFITKYQNKIIRRNFKTRYFESLGNVYLLDKIKYIKDNVVFYEDTNGDADILLMDTFK